MQPRHSAHANRRWHGKIVTIDDKCRPPTIFLALQLLHNCDNTTKWTGGVLYPSVLVGPRNALLHSVRAPAMVRGADLVRAQNSRRTRCAGASTHGLAGIEAPKTWLSDSCYEYATMRPRQPHWKRVVQCILRLSSNSANGSV